MLIHNFQRNPYLSQFSGRSWSWLFAHRSRTHNMSRGVVSVTLLGPKRYFTATTATRRSCGGHLETSMVIHMTNTFSICTTNTILTWNCGRKLIFVQYINKLCRDISVTPCICNENKQQKRREFFTHFGTKFETTAVNNLENNQIRVMWSIASAAQLNIDWEFLISSQPWVKIHCHWQQTLYLRDNKHVVHFMPESTELKLLQNRSDKSQ